MAAQSRGSVKVFVQPEKLSLLAIATAVFSSRFGQDLEQQLGAAPVKFHVLGRRRDALAAFLLLVFPPPPAEPDVHVPAHPALHVVALVS